MSPDKTYLCSRNEYIVVTRSCWIVGPVIKMSFSDWPFDDLAEASNTTRSFVELLCGLKTQWCGIKKYWWFQFMSSSHTYVLGRCIPAYVDHIASLTLGCVRVCVRACWSFLMAFWMMIRGWDVLPLMVNVLGHVFQGSTGRWLQNDFLTLIAQCLGYCKKKDLLSRSWAADYFSGRFLLYVVHTLKMTKKGSFQASLTKWPYELLKYTRSVKFQKNNLGGDQSNSVKIWASTKTLEY